MSKTIQMVYVPDRNELYKKGAERGMFSYVEDAASGTVYGMEIVSGVKKADGTMFIHWLPFPQARAYADSTGEKPYPTWPWDKHREKPTLQGSILNEQVSQHFYVRDGIMQLCSDDGGEK